MNKRNSREVPNRPCLVSVLAAICLAATLVLAQAASACSCYPTPPHEAVRVGPYVFSGTAIKVTTATRSDGDYQITEFQIEKSWRGDASGTVTFVRQNKTTCDVSFREGEHYITAASRTSHGSFETDQCAMFPGASDDDIVTLLDTYPVKVAALDRAIAKNPTDPERYRRKIAFLLDYGDLIAAIDALSDLIAMAPNEAAPLIERGTTYFKLERFDEAWRDFQAALSIAPDSLEAKQGLAATEQLSKIDDPAWNDIYNAWPDLYRAQNPEPDDAFDSDKMCQAEDVSWWIGDMDAVFGNNPDQGRKVLNGLLRIFTRREYGCSANVRQLLTAGADPNTDAYIGTSTPFPIVMVAYANE